MARREKGTGSIYEDPKRPGRYVGEATIDGRRRRVSARTKTDARAKLRQLIAKGEAGELGDTTATVASVVETYLTRELPNLTRNGQPLAPSTQETYRWAAEIITAEIGKVRLTRLTVKNVEAMLDRLAASPRKLSKASLVKLRSKLAQFLDFAQRRDQVHRNVARLAQLPAEAKATRKRSALLPDDARTLLTALRGVRNGAMFALSLRLGLRPGEAAGLWWEDLDLGAEVPTVNVTRGVQLDRGAAAISDDLKTSASKRTLALPADLVEWLAEHRRSQAKERLAAGRWLDPNLVFATSTGHVTDPKANRRDLAAVCETAGVPVVLPNELRHSCASLLADEGVSNEAIADLLGHTTTRMVESTYRHRLRPVVDVAATATWMEAK